MASPAIRWSALASAVALSACLPAYDNQFITTQLDMASNSDGGDGSLGGQCVDSGKHVTGQVFSWGPDQHQAGYRQGIIGNILGSACLSAAPTSSLGAFDIPIPQSALGTTSFFQFHGSSKTMANVDVPLFNMLSGPLLFDGSLDVNQMITRHVVFNQPGGIRDTISKELGIDLSDKTKYGWVYGAFVDKMNVYVDSTVSIVSPPEAVANCTAYYTCEFNLGGPCGAPGAPFIDKAKTTSYQGNYLVVCKKPAVSGMITMAATDGTNPNDQTKVKFPQLSVPISIPNVDFDMVFADWAP